MAIIVNKDIGFGDVFKAYVMINILWQSEEGGRWAIKTTVWPSKKARELRVIQDWLNYRISDVQVNIPYDRDYAEEHGIPKDHWNNVTSGGPWDNIEDLEFLRVNYLEKISLIVQEYQHYFYDSENVKGIPKTIDVSKVKKHFYKSIQNIDSPLFDIFTSSGLSKKDIKDSMKNDLETKKDVILRLAKKDPLLTFLAPSESALMFPPIWE